MSSLAWKCGYGVNALDTMATLCLPTILGTLLGCTWTLLTTFPLTEIHCWGPSPGLSHSPQAPHCSLLPLVCLTSSWVGQSLTSRQRSPTAPVSPWPLTSSSHPEAFAVQLAPCCVLRPLGPHACLHFPFPAVRLAGASNGYFPALTFEQAALAFLGNHFQLLV